MKTEGINNNPLFHINEYYGKDPLRIGSVELVQVGRLFCNPETVIERHAHLGWYELTIVTGGAGIVEANGVELPVAPGDIFISLPYDTHAIYSDAVRPLKYDFFSFYPCDDKKRATLESLSAAIYPADKRIVNNDKIGYLVATITEEISSDAPDRIEIIESAISQIIIYLIRSMNGLSAHNTQYVSDRAMLCFKIMNYIDTHMGLIDNLSELGEVMNYNYSYLSAIFKSETGSTISEYYQQKKLGAAKQLLIDGKLSIKKIAEIFGYSSIYAFSKAFKARYGIAPSKVTKQG